MFQCPDCKRNSSLRIYVQAICTLDVSPDETLTDYDADMDSFEWDDDTSAGCTAQDCGWFGTVGGMTINQEGLQT